MTSYSFSQFGDVTNPGDASAGGSAGPPHPIDSFSTPTSPQDALPMWDSMDHQTEFQRHRQSLHPQLEPIHVPEIMQRPSTSQQVYSHHQTIRIDDAPPPGVVVPSQSAVHSKSHTAQHDDTPFRLHQVHRPTASSASGRGQEHYRSTSPTLAGPSTPLVSRTGRAHAPSQHPYRRPQSAAPGATSNRRPVNAQIPIQQPSRLRVVSNPQVGSSFTGHSVAGSSALLSPALPSPASAPGRMMGYPSSTVSSPVFNTNVPLSTMYPPLRGHHTAFQSRGAVPSTIATYGHATSPSGLDPGSQVYGTEPRSKARVVATDTIYNPIRNTLTSILELPGVHREDIKITLSTSKFNRMRQVVVAGYARDLVAQVIQQDLADAMADFGEPCLSNGAAENTFQSRENMRNKATLVNGLGYDSFGVFRQRKHGEFTRTIIVPHDTKPKDIHAHLQDGLLMIKMDFGNPADSEDLHEVLLR